MRVLTLVEDPDSRAVRQHVSALADCGVTCDVCSPTQGSSSVAAFGRLLGSELCVGSTYDLVHAHGGLAGLALFFQRHLPVVVSTSVGPRSMGYLGRLSARYSDALIVRSEPLRDQFDRECTVVPAGVDLETFRPIPRPDACETAGWDEAAGRVLTQGSDRSGSVPIEDLLETVENRLDVPIEQRDVASVADERLPACLNAAHVYLLASRPRRGTHCIREAMACNLPVVARDVGDAADCLDGVQVSAVCETDAELRDGLTALLDAPCRSSGRSAVRTRSLAVTAERVHQLYREVLSSRDRRGSSAAVWPSTGRSPGARTE